MRVALVGLVPTTAAVPAKLLPEWRRCYSFFAQKKSNRTAAAGACKRAAGRSAALDGPGNYWEPRSAGSGATNRAFRCGGKVAGDSFLLERNRKDT